MQSPIEVCFHHRPIRVILFTPSLAPLNAARIEAFVLLFEHEQRIRALIHAFAEEKDPEKLRVIATELEQLLTLERKPWLVNDGQKRRSS